MARSNSAGLIALRATTMRIDSYSFTSTHASPMIVGKRPIWVRLREAWILTALPTQKTD